MHNEKTEFLKFRIIVEIARKSAYFHFDQTSQKKSHWSKIFLNNNALTFYKSKLFWSGRNRFGQVQIISVRLKLYFFGIIFIIWTCPK